MVDVVMIYVFVRPSVQICLLLTLNVIRKHEKSANQETAMQAKKEITERLWLKWKLESVIKLTIL